MAQGDSPRAASGFVLEDEHPRSAFTNTKAEAVNIIIPEQGFGLTGGEGELADIGTGELHGIFQNLPKGGRASGTLQVAGNRMGRLIAVPCEAKRGQETTGMGEFRGICKSSMAPLALVGPN